MKRLLAVVVAVVLIGGAYLVRSRVIAPAPSERPGDSAAQPIDGGGPRVACVTALAAACDALAAAGAATVTVQDAVTTAGSLSADGPAAFDAWVTSASWAGIAELSRGAGDALFGEVVPVARSPLVVAIWPERAAVLADLCTGGIGWRCLAQAAPEDWASIGGQESWGPVRIGLPDPVNSAEGLAVLGQAAVAEFGADLDRSTITGTEFLGWIDGLTTGADDDANPLGRMLQLGRAGFEIVGVTEATARRVLDATTREVPELFYPEPVVTVDAVVAAVGGFAAANIAAQVADALAGAGWAVPGQARPPELPALPDDDGLPGPGVLEALRQEWDRVS